MEDLPGEDRYNQYYFVYNQVWKKFRHPQKNILKEEKQINPKGNLSESENLERE